jgi:hypothetical protein
MPRFMVFVPASPESEAGELPSQEMLAQMTKYNEQLAEAGIMLEGNGLKPTSQSARIRYEGGQTTVFDGPFAEAKELVAGYWMLEAKSMDEVVEWLKKAPFDGGVELQIRPVFELEDFGDVITPGLRERNERLRKKLQQK